MPTKGEEYKKYIATGLLVVLGLFVVYLLRIFFLALFGAFVFSFMFSPVYIWLKTKLGNDHVAALLTILLVIVVALAPLLIVFYTAFNQSVALQEKLNSLDFKVIFEPLTPKLRAALNLAAERFTRDLSTNLTAVLPSVFAAAYSLAISLFVMFFVMYYIFLDIHYVLIRSTEYLPFNQSNAIWLVRQFEYISKAILLGQIMVSTIQGMLGAVGFVLFGLPDAVLWGIVMAIGSLVPVVGTSIVWLPAGVYLMAHKDYFDGIGIIIWGAVVVSQIDNFVRPRLGQKLGNINPIVMMLGAFAGLEFFGVIGVVVGPFLLAFFLLILQVYRQEYLGHPAPLDRAQVLTEPESD